MKRLLPKMVVMAVGIVALMLIAGCEEEQNSAGAKKSRLIANENMQLKKELEQHNKEIERQKELFAKCQQEKKALEEQSTKDIGQMMDSIVKDVSEENTKLRGDIKNLKAQVSSLESQMAELKNKLAEIKKPEAPKPLQPTVK